MGKGVINSGGDRGIYDINIVYSDGSTEKRAAWCADLTEDLTGEIATAEVPGDTRGVNIMPGYRLLKSNYIPERSGIMVKSQDMPAVAATYNAMIMAGWQKYYPTFRYGTIKYVSTESDWCNVLLDVVYSEVQDETLPINQSVYLVNVPIEYMECNAGPFKIDDQVLVQFQDQDWEQPVVIGFKDNPKSCLIPFTVELTIIDDVTLDEITWENSLYYVAYIEDGEEFKDYVEAEGQAVYDAVYEQCLIDTPYLNCELKAENAKNETITALYYNKAVDDGEILEIDANNRADLEGKNGSLFVISADADSDVSKE